MKKSWLEKNKNETQGVGARPSRHVVVHWEWGEKGEESHDAGRALGSFQTARGLPKEKAESSNELWNQGQGARERRKPR